MPARVKRGSRWLGTAAAACLLLTACSTGTSTSGPDGSGSGAAGKHIKVGVMLKDTSIPFFGRQVAGYRETAKDFGWELDLRNGGGQLASEVAAVQQLVAEHVDMLFVTPDDPQGIVPVLRQANAAGIPVIAVNSGVGDGAQLVTFVGANDEQYGEGLGQLLVKALAPKGQQGNAAVILGRLGDPPTTLRLQGLKKVLAGYPGIHLVAQQTANWDNARALAATQDFLNRYPKGQLDAIVDLGPEGAGGAKYAHDNGRAEVQFVIGDFPAEVKAGVAAGYIYGAVNQDPHDQSVRAMQLAKLWLSGRKSDVPTPTDYLKLPLVTKENVDQFAAAWGG
jgi:ribose transport system substrate-binding protein